ncbi:flavin reductase like domain-containing protein [Cadophora sp. MPI-SDFR-AT-0126]|nr:flavin reductase like domain-containing protein [Leotiomycetes sp. MPI-SDFR-AT-0126]
MFARNGRQLAANCMNGSSAVEKRFFDLLFRWSRVGCAGVGSGLRRSSTKPSPSSSPSIPPKTDPEILAQKTRQIMRVIPHPIVILTTAASSTPGVIDWSKTGSTEAPDPSLYRGMTLSSFTSLSMSPQPLVTFNIGFPSRTLSALTENQHCLIHVLKANPKGMALADAFTKGNIVQTTSLEGENEHESGREDLEANVKKSITAFELAAQTESNLKVRLHTIKRPRKADVHLPIIDSIALKAVLECKILGQGEREGGGLIRIGDHALVIAKVTGIAEVADFSPSRFFPRQGRMSSGNALCYVDGVYTAAGSTWGVPG